METQFGGVLRGGDIRSPPLRLCVDSQPAIQAPSARHLLVSGDS